jgi:hypothetical protein
MENRYNTITAKEFNDLGYAAKSNIFWDYCNFLGERVSSTHVIQTFEFFGFYVQVFYLRGKDDKTMKVDDIVAIESEDELDELLEHIDICSAL